MDHEDPSRSAGVRRLAELMRRVNSSTEPAEVLEEIVHGVTEVLGFGVAAVARIEGDTLVMTTVSGPEHVRRQIIGRRTPVSAILGEFAQADEWGPLRFVPHDRLSPEAVQSWWVPELTVSDEPDAWHPLDALYAPLYSATGELLGNMSVDLPPGNKRPDPQLRELLEMFVVQAGLVMSNAQQRERLAEQVRLAETLQLVTTAGNPLDPGAMLDRVSRVVLEGYRASQVYLRYFAEDERGRTRALGYPENDVLTPSVSRMMSSLARLAHEQGRPLVVTAEGLDTGATTDPGGVRRMLTRTESNLVVAVPLAVGNEMLGGLMMLRARGATAMTEAEIDVLSEIGRELGQVVLNSRVYDTERRLVAELQELDRYKGELIATISHELKTPLTSIIGHTELLVDLETEIQSVAAIARNAERLNRLVDSLLNYSRVQDKREYLRTPVDLVSLCENTMDLLAMQVDQGGLRMRLEHPEDPVLVRGDAEELARVVDNIVGNAVKYTPTGGRIDVTVRRDDRFAEVVCADTGIGISLLDQTHLFSAFSRSSNPEALSMPGSGLGLAISRRITETHGGYILVDSALGQGSTFRVRLPVYTS